MKRSELHYRTPRDDSYSPRHRSNQPQPRSSLNDDTEERIVMLYTSGQSVEAITREVGRARHRVVHTLQTRGVFGINLKEPIQEEPKSESFPVEVLEEAPAIEEAEPKPLAVEGAGPEIAIEETYEHPKPERKSESPRKLKPIATGIPSPASLAVGEPQVTGRWQPLVVDALCEVILRLNLYPGMSHEEVRKMVSGWNRQSAS